MKPTACLLTVALLALPAASEPLPTPAAGSAPRGRGWLTATGLGLVATSVLAGTLGLGFQLGAADANRRVASYYPAPNIAPPVQEARAVKSLSDQRDASQALAVSFFVAAAATLAGGLTCLVTDGAEPTRALQVAVVPGPSTLSVWLGTRF